MTIQQFQELYFIFSSEDQDFDKSIKMVGAVTGKTPEQVESMPMLKFNYLCKVIAKQFEIFNKDLDKSKPKKIIYVAGRFYRINYEVRNINAAQYIETLTFSKDIIQNLHKVMASIVTPVNILGKPYKRDHELIAKDMEQMNFEHAYHASVFFYTFYNVSMHLSRPYFLWEMKKLYPERAEEILKTSMQILDGYSMPKWSVNLKGYLLTRFGTLK
jgi:hypothetical protein